MMIESPSHDSPLSGVLTALERLGSMPKQVGDSWRARCPAHDDRHPSLTASCGADGRVLLHCHAGCSQDVVIAALKLAPRDLFPVSERARVVSRKYEIRGADGELAARHFRHEHPDGRKFYSWRRPDGSKGLGGRPLKSLPLYGAERLSSYAVEAPIVLVEGEKACDALTRAGIPAVASVTGASTCPGREALSALAGRRVILWPDADGPGHNHMARLAAALKDMASDVRIFVWSSAPLHGDAFDYLDSGAERAATLNQDLLTAMPAAEWLESLKKAATVVSTDTVDHADAGTASDPEPTHAVGSVATRMAALADNAELFHTAGQQAFATIEVNTHRETMRIGSLRFSAWLRQRWFAETGSAPPAKAVSEAVALLEARAIFDSAEQEVHARMAEHEGNVYIDLANDAWEAIEVTAKAWSIVQHPPVKFCRYRGMSSLPTPIRGGSIELLRPFMNLGSDEDWILVSSWIMSSLRPGGPHPVLGIHGEQGSTKSTMARLLRSIIDPNQAPLRTEPSCARDLMIGATNSWVQAYDNVSHVPNWLSDALCRLSTGGAFATRELYSDAEEVIFRAQRPVMLNGIGDLATRGDLLERMIILSLPRIPADGRRTEAELWAEFERVRPLILGALLDALSVALRVHQGIRLKQSPRMADFATWASAASISLGWGPGAFARAYGENRRAGHEVALEGSLLAGAVRSWVAEQECWEGTATELLAALQRYAPDSRNYRSGWPANAQALSAALTRLAPNLRESGVGIESHRIHGGRRIITLRVGAVTAGDDVPRASIVTAVAPALEFHGFECEAPLSPDASPAPPVRIPGEPIVTVADSNSAGEGRTVTRVTEGKEGSD